ncbi:hypothetical protein D4764_0264650 [Takifugu flavidus]|uniref:SGNH hydrolase-type esterase domain-containing protein n=1 Tax=Takifugu flavidus TaxID=433684 RepID=A0A5C6MGI4_9TELE|nr:hypothetical protein D4764_0264650 [Takifugu flavidus]
MAVCESCLPTFSLRESISGLQSELKERDTFILESSAVASTRRRNISRLRSEGQGLRVDLLDLSTVAMSQAKQIALLKASGAGDRSTTATNDTTLPWTGSINAEIPATAPAESRRHRQGAMPKGAAHSTSFLRPRSRRVSSPGTEQEPSWLSPDEEPESARSTWPSATILVRSSHDPAPPSPGSSPPPPHLQTFCHPGARVAEVTSSALQLSAQHPSASTLVLEAGINDLKFQQSEVLKQDFISLVDRLLDTGKRLIISGPLPPPRYGDVVTSRLHQLHLWLKGYCLGNSIPSLTILLPFK